MCTSGGCLPRDALFLADRCMKRACTHRLQAPDCTRQNCNGWLSALKALLSDGTFSPISLPPPTTNAGKLEVLRKLKAKEDHIWGTADQPGEAPTAPSI